VIERELERRAPGEPGDSGDDSTEVVAEVSGESDGPGKQDAVDAGIADWVPTGAPAERARDLVSRWISFYVKQVVEADAKGIVILDAIHGEPALVIRVREAMERHLGEAATHAFQMQAPKYLGVSDLAEWLSISREDTVQEKGEKQHRPVGFFPWHVSLYHNRPILWLVSSEGFERGRTRVTFRAYLHYPKLTSDTLPRLVAYHLDPTIAEAERQWSLSRDEAGRLEGKAKASATARADEWANTVDALRRFRDAVEAVIQGPARAEPVQDRAKWQVRTIAEVRGGRDVGHGYRPDIDLGVRVNITPLVERRLFPRVVLKRLGG
jgi:hypothetical protein